MANGTQANDLETLAGGLEWRCIGPHRGGRVVAVAGDPAHESTFYFGACAGGVWKSDDGGTFWRNVSDGFFTTAAVGAIAVAASDPNVLYVGTGETCIRGNVSHGDGVYKSTDAGKTWANVGLKDTRHIAKIRVHPRNPDVVYVAALGHTWGPNDERGVYRSKDGGESWERVLFRSERAGAIDLTLDPHNPRILYAAIWEAQRYPHALVSGGEGSGIFKSADGGDTWTEITRNKGLPAGVLGKIGLAVSPAQSGRVWALVEAEDGALFRSDDGGATWQRLSEEGQLRARAWYYMHIFADPRDPETVWVLDYQCWKSVDGGKTFRTVPTPHGDVHDLWIDPNDTRRMILGDDGGACVTYNGAVAWSTQLNQPTAQFYHVAADDRFPYQVYGSQQDNSAIALPSASVLGTITLGDWFEPGGGESGYIAVKPDDQDIVVAGAIGSGAGNGRLIHYDHRTGQQRIITVWPEATGMGDGAVDLKYRFQWTFPIFFSKHHPDELYIAGNRVFRSTDQGGSWEAISPDLTRNDPEKQQPSGGPITKDNTGAEAYDTIFALAESPHQAGVLWAGSDDGLIHLSKDGGKTWQNITPPADLLPEWALISIIEPSPHDPATAYVAATRYKHDDTRPYLLKTSDYGASWQAITSGIPADEFTRTIREDPERRGLLYAGTETGVYVSFDDGGSWRRLPGNLPVAPIHDLLVKDGDLVAATHGRSFWILDDLTPLRELAANADLAAPRLFSPRPTVRFKTYPGYGSSPAPEISYSYAGTIVYGYEERTKPNGEKERRPLNAGQNPPEGAIVYYALPEKPEGEIALTFLDAAGKEIRTLTSKPPEEAKKQDGKDKDKEKEEDREPRVPKEAGLNRFAWNLRHPDAHKVPGDKSTEDALAGPIVPPGRYQVRLTVGDHTATAPFELLPDPRLRATQADLEAQFALLMQIRDKLSETHDAIVNLRDLREQLDRWERRAGDRAEARGVKEAAQQAKKRLDEIEGALIQVKAESPLSYPSRLNSRLAALTGMVDSADTAPTRQQREVYADLAARIDRQLAALRDAIATDVEAVNRQVREAGLPVVG
ncbi:MAG TPA: glycosyl hydrolase [Thermomicrobiales bacterium]|nr:glycosyl hydrolase [Thermomicrobiales bacterium]